MRGIAVAALIAAGFLIASEASAQQPQTVRIRGTIEKIDGDLLLIKSRDGADLTVKMADNVRVTAIVKAALSDIKPNSYVGVTAMPQVDGSQKAIAIAIFPESARGAGDGHRPWDLRPNSTMTNATVDTMVAGVDGETITLKYKDGEKKVIVPPDAVVVTSTPSDKSELKAGAKILIFGATKQPDGTFGAASVNVGRDGLTPPM
jgi:hypothetical protein